MLGITPELTSYIIFITVLTGLVMGSFSNCLAERTNSSESILKSRSKCPNCGHVLSALELIPVFSWLFLRGRCKNCKKKISVRYPLTELFMGLIFVAIILKYDVTPKAFEFLILSVIIFTAALVDFDSQILPDRFFVAAIIDFLVFTLVLGGNIPQNLLFGLINGLSISVPLLIFVLLYDHFSKKECMGGGDIKLFFALGLFFDWKVNLLMLIFSCLIGIVFFLILSHAKSDTKKDTPFPFGPSIVASAFVCMIVGENLVSAYLSLF